MEARKDQYEAYVKSVTPVHSTWKNVLMAGISGRLICLAAQISTNCLVQTGMEEKTAALWTMLGLILLSVILTGANVFQRLARVLELVCWFRSPDSPIQLHPRRWNTRRKDRCLVSDAKYLQSRVR